MNANKIFRNTSLNTVLKQKANHLQLVNIRALRKT